MRESTEQELWKPIAGFPDYEVSSLGRVWSGRLCRGQQGTMRKLTVNKNRSLQVTVWRDRRTVHYLVSRLVAEAFLPDWNPALQVDHIDGDRSNNAVSNLRMASRTQNLKAYQTPRKGATSRFRGVSWHKAKRKWQAQIRFNQRVIHLGYFACETKAAKARDSKALKFGYMPESLNKTLS